MNRLVLVCLLGIHSTKAYPGLSVFVLILIRILLIYYILTIYNSIGTNEPGLHQDTFSLNFIPFTGTSLQGIKNLSKKLLDRIRPSNELPSLEEVGLMPVYVIPSHNKDRSLTFILSNSKNLTKYNEILASIYYTLLNNPTYVNFSPVKMVIITIILKDPLIAEGIVSASNHSHMSIQPGMSDGGLERN